MRGRESAEESVEDSGGVEEGLEVETDEPDHYVLAQRPIGDNSGWTPVLEVGRKLPKAVVRDEMRESGLFGTFALFPVDGNSRWRSSEWTFRLGKEEKERWERERELEMMHEINQETQEVAEEAIENMESSSGFSEGIRRFLR